MRLTQETSDLLRKESNSGQLAAIRGYMLDADDRLRAQVIMNLMCQFMVQKKKIEQKFKVKFDEYFAFELKNLQHFANEGLVGLYPDRIVVTPKGKLV